MIDTHEPKDGDFIAYIERLQEESAARLQLHITIDSDQAASKATQVPSAGSPPQSAKFGPSTNEQLHRHLGTSTSALRLVTGGFAALVGAVLFLRGFIFDGGALSMLIGIGLLVWALPRLRSAPGTPGAAKRALSREMIEQWFGTKPK